MEFKKIIKRDNRFVVLGKWDKKFCYEDIANFPFNPLTNGCEKRARILAERFAEIIKSEDLDSKLNRYTVREIRKFKTWMWGVYDTRREMDIGLFKIKDEAVIVCDCLNNKDE